MRALRQHWCDGKFDAKRRFHGSKCFCNTVVLLESLWKNDLPRQMRRERWSGREMEIERQRELAGTELHCHSACLGTLHMPGHLCLVLTQPEEDYPPVDSTAGGGWNRIQLNTDRHTNGALCFWEFLKHKTAARLKSSGGFHNGLLYVKLKSKRVTLRMWIPMGENQDIMHSTFSLSWCRY